MTPTIVVPLSRTYVHKQRPLVKNMIKILWEIILFSLIIELRQLNMSSREYGATVLCLLWSSNIDSRDVTSTVQWYGKCCNRVLCYQILIGKSNSCL